MHNELSKHYFDWFISTAENIPEVYFYIDYRPEIDARIDRLKYSTILIHRKVNNAIKEVF